MFLHRLCVENYRSLRDLADLSFVSAGLNLVHGPNEAGKSTLMDALCRGFFDRHDTRSSTMFDRQPWDSSLGPSVLVEFETGGGRYQVRKRFLVDPLCELAQWRDGRWEKVAQGKTADEQVVQLVAGGTAGAGLSQPKHWGLAQVLWVCQGQATTLELDDSQQDRLHRAMQLTLTSRHAEAIEQGIRARYDQVWTPTGKYRKGQNQADVLRLEEELAEARRHLDQVQQARHEVEDLADQLARAEQENERIREQHRQAAADLEKARQDLETANRQQVAYAKVEAASAQARTAWERLNEHASRIRTADDHLAAAKKQVEQLAGHVRQATESVQPAQAALENARQQRDRAIEALAAAETRLESAERRVRWSAASQRLGQLATERASLARLQLDAETVGSDLQGLKAPTAKELASLRELDRQVRQVQAQLQAACLNVRIEPDVQVALQVQIDQQPVETRQSGQPFEVLATSTVILQIPGVGRVRIRGGKTDAAGLNQQMGVLQSQWREQTQPFGASDLKDLDDRAGQRALLEDRLQSLQGRLRTRGKTETLDAQLQQQEGLRQELLAADPKLADQPIDPQEAQSAAEEARRQRKEAQEARTLAVRAFDVAAGEVAKVARSVTDIETRMAQAAAVVTTREQDAVHLRRQDGLSDPDRYVHLLDALKAKDEAQQRLDATARPDLNGTQGRVQRLQQEELSLRDALQRQIEGITERKTRLRQAGAQGLYSQYAVSMERLEQLRCEHARAELDAKAIKILSDTLQRHRQDLLANVAEPVHAIVIGDMERLAGRRYNAIRFNKQMRPDRVRPASREQDAAIDSLSYGTQEQLMLLVRLALARLLSRQGERQCVILDDPLVNTDADRQKAALAILEEAAKETQILVFTCHPGAYAGVQARCFDMASLTAKA
jgi:DNA repair protein SbcC/Rad50